MSSKKITVYTPIYNRAYCVGQLYESLKRQTNKDFLWLIIDDGSTDNIKGLVEGWINEEKIVIQYFYQENKGKQEAVNYAHKIMTTELNTCVDSDDYLVDDAIDYILSEWDKNKNPKIAGLVGLDADKNYNIIGTKFPEGLTQSKFSHFKDIHKIKGDKKFIFRTDVTRQYVYPQIDDEKFPAPGYIYRLIDQDYDLVLLNKILCIVEYLPDGISKNKFSQFKKSSHSFMFYRHERMRLAVNYMDRFQNAIHYVNVCLIAKKNIFKKNRYKITTFFAFPFGIFLHLYLMNTKKSGVV